MLVINLPVLARTAPINLQREAASLNLVKKYVKFFVRVCQFGINLTNLTSASGQFLLLFTFTRHLSQFGILSSSSIFFMMTKAIYILTIKASFDLKIFYIDFTILANSCCCNAQILIKVLLRRQFSYA